MTGETPAERYVADRMSPEETAAFEAEMLANPSLAADVDVRQRMRAGLERLRERGELAPLLEKKPVRRFAVAASLAAALLIGGVTLWRGGLLPAPTALSLASLVDRPAEEVRISQRLFVTRDASVTPTIKLELGSPPLRLRLMPDPDSQGPYTVEFAGSRRVLDAADGYVDIYLRGEAAGTAVYEATMTPATGATQSFTLKVEVTP